jgi:hypothetical protein
MRIRAGLLALCLAAPLPCQAASPFAQAASTLDGQWKGDDFMLKIDSTRAQASLDPARPFEWRRFLVQSVSGETVTFSVGPDVFEARIADDELKLTGTTFRGERTLVRHEPAALEPALSDGSTAPAAPPASSIEPGFRGSGD